jgi:hypothetical protein
MLLIVSERRPSSHRIACENSPEKPTWRGDRKEREEMWMGT